MSKDYRLEVLQLAVEGKLPKDINVKGEHSHLLSACVELEESGYLNGVSGRDSHGEPCDFHFFNITPEGRDYLEELCARRPANRFTAKTIDILVTVLTAAITAVIVTLITNRLSK